jgi:putative ABC transport system ATP-binding protein
MHASVGTRAPVVRLDHVVKTYDDDGLRVTAVDGVSLEIAARRLAMIVGPSGSGKTTLLNLIGCIDGASAGRVEVCGHDVNALTDNQKADFRSRYVAFVFQTFNLFPVLSAYENIEYPLLLLGLPAPERRARTLAMLEAVELAAFARHRPNQLSGGQRQRVAVARALVKKPALVLADEPTANLDTRTGAAIIDLMRRMQEEHDVSFVFCTHDPQLISHAQETSVIQDGRLVDHRTEQAS